MKEDIEKALERARTPEPLGCGECNEMMFSPMDKLCISLYGKCAIHLTDDSIEEKNLLEIAQSI